MRIPIFFTRLSTHRPNYRSARRPVARAYVCLLAVPLLLAACWNGGNTHVRMGDVSLGQQLIDLKRALDQQALTQEEYVTVRSQILSLASKCGYDDVEGD